MAAVVLLAALARHDFSFQYVADHTSRELPLGYTLTAFWGGQEGSLLLWLLVLTRLFRRGRVHARRAGADVLAWVVPVLGLVGTFFALLLAFVASPFATQAAAADGAGLNPSLQNPYMAVHPPMLYLGYVGLTIPFAFAMGALLARRADERWIVATRRWTLAAWAFLGIGQLLGAHWAYVEIGWAATTRGIPWRTQRLMPWLAATAFLHSVMIQEKRGMLKVWNVLLVVLAFCLSLFGTFLTRSGIIQSIHSFTQSSIGPGSSGSSARSPPVARARVRAPAFVALQDASRVARVSRGDVPLQQPAARRARAHDPVGGRVSDPVGSRDGAGVNGQQAVLQLLPAQLRLAAAACDGDRAARGLEAGIAPCSRTHVPVPLTAAVVAGAVLLALGAGSSRIGVIAYTFSVFVIASIVLEFARGTAARRALGGVGWGAALASLIARNRRRYGGYVVHAAVVLLAIGITGSSSYETVREARLHPGQSLTVAGDRLRLPRLRERDRGNHRSIRGARGRLPRRQVPRALPPGEETSTSPRTRSRTR